MDGTPGVQLMDLDIYTFQEVLTRTLRSDGLRHTISDDPDFHVPTERTGTTYVEDVEDYATTIKTHVYATPPDKPYSIQIDVDYRLDRYGDITTHVQKIE